MKHKLLKTLITGVMVCSAHALAAQSINEVITQTLQSNPDALASVSNQLASKQRIEQAKSGYYPKADINLGIGKEWTDGPSTNFDNKTLTRKEAGVGVTQMIYDGYSTKSQVDSAELAHQASNHQINDTYENIAFAAAKAYLDVLRGNELVKIAEDNLVAHQSVSDQIRLRSNSGVGRQSDVDQSKARVALAQSNVFAAEGNQTDATTTYTEVVGEMPIDLDIEQPGCCNLVPETLQEAIDIALQKHPAIHTETAFYEAAMANINAAKSAHHPKFNFEVEGNADDDIDGVEGTNKELLAMFRLRYNLYNGGADSARIDETEFLAAQQREYVYGVQRDIEEGVRLAWNALQNATMRLPYLKTHAVSAERTHASYQQQFNLGQRTLLDLLDQENEKFTAQSDYINGVYDEKVACYRLLARMGVILETLDIVLVEAETEATE